MSRALTPISVSPASSVFPCTALLRTSAHAAPSAWGVLVPPRGLHPKPQHPQISATALSIPLAEHHAFPLLSSIGKVIIILGVAEKATDACTGCAFTYSVTWIDVL